MKINYISKIFQQLQNLLKGCGLVQINSVSDFSLLVGSISFCFICPQTAVPAAIAILLCT